MLRALAENDEAAGGQQSHGERGEGRRCAQAGEGDGGGDGCGVVR